MFGKEILYALNLTLNNEEGRWKYVKQMSKGMNEIMYALLDVLTRNYIME